MSIKNFSLWQQERSHLDDLLRWVELKTEIERICMILMILSPEERSIFLDQIIEEDERSLR